MDPDDLDELIRTGSEGKCDRGDGAERHADVFILEEGFSPTIEDDEINEKDKLHQLRPAYFRILFNGVKNSIDLLVSLHTFFMGYFAELIYNIRVAEGRKTGTCSFFLERPEVIIDGPGRPVDLPDGGSEAIAEHAGR